MLKLKHITKDYVTKQNTIHVLKDLTLNFRECEFVTILGQSGCGKTTLLNIVGGLDRYTSGDIIINGKSTKDFDDRDWDKYRNKQIGFVFQSYNLIPHLNILRNVELALTLAGKKKEEREQRAMEALKKVGLEDQAYKKPNQLSGGQMQRVAIARALVNNPAIILADEPTGALDTESGIMVMELLKEVASDRLVIMVSHNAELAKEYSTRTVRIVDGKIVDDTDPLIDENDVEEETPVVEEVTADGKVKKTVRQRIKKSYKQITQERKEERKVSMNGATTIGLSARNLYSKKWRTFLTSFAGSIGIIGISLVLALSAGVNTYITGIEESALSIYPLQITKSSADLMELANMLMEKSEGVKYPNSTDVTINKVAGKLLGFAIEDTLSSLFFDNDLSEVKLYLDNEETGIKAEDGYVKYIYSSNLNVYRQIQVQDENTGEFFYMALDGTEYCRAIYDEAEDKYYYAEKDADGEYVIENGKCVKSSRAVVGGIPYTKVNPILDSIGPMLNMLPTEARSAVSGMISGFSSYLESFTMFSELIESKKILNEQYDVIAGDWASDDPYIEYDADGNEICRTYDCVLCVDECNKISDFYMFAVGMVHPSTLEDMLLAGDTTGTAYNFFDRVFTEDDIIGMEYMILADTDYYSYNSDTGLYEGAAITSDSEEFVNNACGIKLRVSGIVRPKENSSASAINGLIGYPHSLVESLVNRCQTSDIAQAQLANCYTTSGAKIQVSKLDESSTTITGSDYILLDENGNPVDVSNVEFRSVITGNKIEVNTGTADISSMDDLVNYIKFEAEDSMANLYGYSEIENPERIDIYALSFDGKKNILETLDNYQYYSYDYGTGKWVKNDTANSNHAVKYTDMLATIMGYVEQMSNAMVTALLAFSAVSLIVSSIMIAIITYTSVLERRKEIGVLRSIGARKLDISNLFVSESSIIGVISGVLGIAFGYMLIAIANAIIGNVLSVENLMRLDWYYAIGLIVISFLLSLIAGIIPASIAANKDPVEALRSE